MQLVFLLENFSSGLNVSWFSSSDTGCPFSCPKSLQRFPLVSFYTCFPRGLRQPHAFQFNIWADNSLIRISCPRLSCKLQLHISRHLPNTCTWRSNRCSDSYSDPAHPQTTTVGVFSNSLFYLAAPICSVGKHCWFIFRLAFDDSPPTHPHSQTNPTSLSVSTPSIFCPEPTLILLNLNWIMLWHLCSNSPMFSYLRTKSEVLAWRVRALRGLDCSHPPSPSPSLSSSIPLPPALLQVHHTCLCPRPLNLQFPLP